LMVVVPSQNVEADDGQKNWQKLQRLDTDCWI